MNQLRWTLQNSKEGDILWSYWGYSPFYFCLTESSLLSESKVTKPLVKTPRSRSIDSAEPGTSQGFQYLFNDSTTKERGRQQARDQSLSPVNLFRTNWPSLPTSLSQDSSKIELVQRTPKSPPDNPAPSAFQGLLASVTGILKNWLGSQRKNLMTFSRPVGSHVTTSVDGVMHHGIFCYPQRRR